MSYFKNANFANKYAKNEIIKKKVGIILMDFAAESSYRSVKVYGKDLASYVWQHNFYQDQSEYYWVE